MVCCNRTFVVPTSGFDLSPSRCRTLLFLSDVNLGTETFHLQFILNTFAPAVHIDSLKQISKERSFSDLQYSQLNINFQLSPKPFISKICVMRKQRMTTCHQCSFPIRHLALFRKTVVKGLQLARHSSLFSVSLRVGFSMLKTRR